MCLFVSWISLKGVLTLLVSQLKVIKLKQMHRLFNAIDKRSIFCNMSGLSLRSGVLFVLAWKAWYTSVSGVGSMPAWVTERHG